MTFWKPALAVAVVLVVVACTDPATSSEPTDQRPAATSPSPPVEATPTEVTPADDPFTVIAVDTPAPRPPAGAVWGSGGLRWMFDVRLAEEATEAAQQWRDMGAEPPEVDFTDEVLLMLRTLGPVSCPIDDIEAITEAPDDEDVWEIRVATSGSGCTGQRRPQALVATIDRSTLPDPPYTLRFAHPDPVPVEIGRTVADHHVDIPDEELLRASDLGLFEVVDAQRAWPRLPDDDQMPVDITVVATADELARWDDLPVNASDVDFAEEVLVIARTVGSGSCRFDGIAEIVEVPDADAIWEVRLSADVGPDESCTDDAVANGVVATIDRSTLPTGAFTVQMEVPRAAWVSTRTGPGVVEHHVELGQW